MERVAGSKPHQAEPGRHNEVLSSDLDLGSDRDHPVGPDGGRWPADLVSGLHQGDEAGRHMATRLVNAGEGGRGLPWFYSCPTPHLGVVVVFELPQLYLWCQIGQVDRRISSRMLGGRGRKNGPEMR